MYWKNREPEVELDEDGNIPDLDASGDYRGAELEAMADALLKNYAKQELCRECLDESEREVAGEPNGTVVPVPQFDEGEPVIDESGRQLIVDFPEIQCDQGHTWFKGEGKARKNDGRNAVLFEDHLAQRRRREIYTSEGTPDPNIVSGIYNRTHPQGRKVNTETQRKSHGASFYR